MTKQEMIQNKIETLNADQREMFNLLISEILYQFRVPTGFGKGYVFMIHIWNQIVNSSDETFAIVSHRLSLNNQHLRDMINDVIELNLIEKVRFLSVGSKALDIEKALKGSRELKELNRQIYDINSNREKIDKINRKDLFKSTLNQKEVTEIINDNSKKGLKTIIISTYNSMDKLKNIDMDVVYFDEAHMLATNRDISEFEKNYKVIEGKIKSKFFFTATPKEIQEDLSEMNIFLMNNTDVFGKIFSKTFKECIDKGYIISPITHIVSPDILKEGINYDSIENKGSIIIDSYNVHNEWLDKISSDSNEIGAKILVRCESVDNMWELVDYLNEQELEDVIICAGASRNDTNNILHIFNREEIKDRDVFVKKIQDVGSSQKMIILNYDIFSEGINIPGLTGVMFMQKILPTISKIIQIIGRATRLHLIDRMNFRDGKIEVGSEGWIKPNCAIIIPFWDNETENTKKQLIKLILGLRDDLNFSPSMILSIGDDYSLTKKRDDLDYLNKLSDKNKKWDPLLGIYHDIEEIYKERERNELNKISNDELLIKMLGSKN